MPATPLSDARRKYPNLPIEIIKFFDIHNISFGSKPRGTTVIDFIGYYRNNISDITLQPQLVVQICRIIVDRGWMSEISSGGVQGENNRYASVVRAGLEFIDNPIFARMVECAVYGPPAAYDYYSSSVLPIVNGSSDGNQQIGTCFVVSKRSIVTAAHCIDSAAWIAIRGVNYDALSRARFYIHPNEGADLSVVIFDNDVFDVPEIPLPTEETQILDEVIALGYPNIPGFHPILTAELANVSSRLTVSRGRVVSKPTEIFARTELFLITARVRGGFSGGPVLDRYGQAIGVISREPAADTAAGSGHRYDELGYGTVIPETYIRNMQFLINNGEIKSLNMQKVVFQDFD